MSETKNIVNIQSVVGSSEPLRGGHDNNLSGDSGSNIVAENSNVTPFTCEWAFGSKNRGTVLNLSYGGRGLVAYTAAHTVVLYDYKSHSQRVLIGHRNGIVAMDVDERGDWLVTADASENDMDVSEVIVWNIRKRCIAKVLGNRYPPKDGYSKTAISPDGRYIVAVAAGPRKHVYFWCWQDDDCTQPNDTLELPGELGTAQAVYFKPDIPECFLITCDKNVVFLSWVDGAINHYVAELLKAAGKMVHSIFQSYTPNAVSITSRGYVVVWTDPPVYNPKSKVSRKMFCIEKGRLTTVTEVDSMTVIGTARGHVLFFDRDINLLHWYQQAELDSIVSLSFSREAPDPYCDFAWADRRTSFPTVVEDVLVEDRAIEDAMPLSTFPCGPHVGVDSEIGEFNDTEPETAAPGNVKRKDARSFMARDLVVYTSGGIMALVSFVKGRCVILKEKQAAISVVQIHPEKHQLLVGKMDGSVTLYDYDTKRKMVKVPYISKALDAEPIPVSSLKYSPNGLVLACGLADGCLYFLHPELLTPMCKPFRKTLSQVLHIVYSLDSRFLAHHDTANYVSAYRCIDFLAPSTDDQEPGMRETRARPRWMYLGKKHAHSMPVRYLIFGPQLRDAPLFSVGEDRVLVEYNVAKSINNSLLMVRADRVEQAGTPRFVSWCPHPYSKGDDGKLVLLMVTSEFKYKLIDLDTRRTLVTLQGPNLGTPVHLIKTLGETDTTKAPSVAVYCTEQGHLGLQMLPPDGDPFKNAALIANPLKVKNFVISAGDEFVFTIGHHHFSVIMWRIHRETTELLRQGGEARGRFGLSPWLMHLEGGQDGWVFSEIQDAFCYAQILHQGITVQKEHPVTDQLPLCEVPDLVRTLGYFPSQFEIENMLHEVMHRHTGDTMSFQEFVKLFTNHKPCRGLSVDRLREAFLMYAYQTDDGELTMTREKFLSVLIDKGEPMVIDEVQDVMHALLGRDPNTGGGLDDFEDDLNLIDERTRREQMFHYLPETITFSYFVETLLGIVMKNPSLF